MKKIAVIGQGYVGLPLAIAFSKVTSVVGFDIDDQRVTELNAGIDCTLEIEEASLQEALQTSTQTAFIQGYKASTNIEDIRDASVYIVTVPTPTNQFKAPDLTPLQKASEMIASVLKSGDIVIYESTVYPGCTEEDCVPILERFSGLKLNQDRSEERR